MANNTGTFFNINDNDGIPLVGVSTDGKVMINHLYGNCLIGSTSVTGTASQPLQVTGGAYVSGNVGVGTTNPTSKLQVVGDINFTGNLYQNGTIFQSGGGGGTSSQWVTYGADISTTSNVGIGTTNPTSKLQVVGDGNFTGVVTATTFFGDTSNATDGRWTISNNGSSNYTFTGIGFTQTTNNPVLYLVRGRVYAFVITSGGSHPFQIRESNGGSAYNNGVTNNGATSGVLRFEVPFNAPNTLYYQCTSHSGMGATIFVIPRNEPAVGVRTTVAATTSSIGANATSNLNINGFKTYSLLKVGISNAAWVVLYTDSTSRSNDSSRSYLTDPTPGSGVIAEVRTVSSGISTFIMSPGVIGWNNDVSVGSTIYARVTNNQASSSVITVTLTVVKLED